MEVKKNLNNTQRKMLDQIYVEQFDKRARMIRESRRAGREKLMVQLLAKESEDEKIQEMLDAGRKFYLLYEELKPKLAVNGVSVDNNLNKIPKLYINQYSRANKYVDLQDYDDETDKIELSLSEKKKEMRAKIYGVAASYEDVDKEIKELLKDI